MLLQRVDDNLALLAALFAVIAMIVVGMATPASAVAGEETPAFAPGEVMVKFRAGTEASRAVSRSARGDPPSLEGLMPTSRLLTEKTGIPLRAKQLLSGDWVLFVIDLDMLTTQASAQLKKQDNVTDVGLEAGETGGVSQPATKDLDVTFRPGSPAAALIEETATADSEKRLAALVEDLGKRLALPFSGKVEAKHLRLRVDLQKLTAQLAERLGGFGDMVESAQLNYIARAM
ncbi:MAG: hypothetical protein MUF20_00340 [Methylotetracoccus sp.]|nr:hypothetical protein [Methylotetracoccus sp.]